MNSEPKPFKIQPAYSVSDPQFRQTVGNLLGPPLIDGNRVQTLTNGDQIFPAMLDAIRSAQKTIDFETYIYWSGNIGSKFTEALCERARAGTKVHVIIDSVGSDRIDQDYIKRMHHCGIAVVEYHGLHWYDWTSAQKLNNRTHRKILVVDGNIGFIGGVGIADEWQGNADSPEHWRDSHYRVEGPVVAQLQAAFLDNWIKTTGQVLHDADYFPPPQLPGPANETCAAARNRDGGQWAQVFKSSSRGGSQSMQMMYLLSIAAARETVLISSAYFVPDDLTVDALIDARQRGVRICIIVPGKHIDEKIVRAASQARWGKLLKAGVEIHEFQPTMFHCKLMVVDGRWVSIGSSNLDERSFRLNDEANLNVLDESFAAEQVKVFNEDLARSKRITYDHWRHRPWHLQLTDGLTALFLHPLL